jgi:chorismate dehydratase
VNSTDPWNALRGLRIGCVKYLNSRPLICAYDGPVVFDHPSSLAKMLAAGELDAALVPVFEAVRDPYYRIVDDVAVGCDGPVFSVFLAYRGELRDVRSVGLDPASMSSANLLRVLLSEFHGVRPEFGASGDARLLIGNQAIEFRQAEEGRSEWKFFDLGEEWKRSTGLPFVFAVWALRSEVQNPAAVADAFRALKSVGCARIPELIQVEDFGDVEMRRRYLTEWLRFDIGAAGCEAIALYRKLLAKHGLIAGDSVPLEFV